MVFLFFWLTSLGMVISRSIHVAANGIIFFFYMADTISLYIYVYTRSFFIYVKLEDNYFTMLCWFLPCNNVNQPKVYTCCLFLNLPLTATQPHPLGYHRAPGRAPCVLQQLSTSRLFCGWYCGRFSAALSIHAPSPSPAVSTSLLLCLQLCSCPTDRLISTIF